MLGKYLMTSDAIEEDEGGDQIEIPPPNPNVKFD